MAYPVCGVSCLWRGVTLSCPVLGGRGQGEGGKKEGRVPLSCLGGEGYPYSGSVQEGERGNPVL